MPVLTCPHCHRQGRAAAHLAGQNVACPHCRQSIRVPTRRPRPPVPVAQGNVSVRVEQPEADDPDTGPSGLAYFCWLVVLVCAGLVCALIGVVAYLAWTLPPTDAPEFVIRYRALLVFGIAAQALLPTYILARAVDRLTQ